MESKRLPGAVRLTAKQSFPAALTVRQSSSTGFTQQFYVLFVLNHLFIAVWPCRHTSVMSLRQSVMQEDMYSRKTHKEKASWKEAGNLITSQAFVLVLVSRLTGLCLGCRKNTFFFQVVWTLVCRTHGFEKFITDMSLKEQCPCYLVPQFRSPWNLLSLWKK